MKLYQEYSEKDELTMAFITFCWKDRSAGTILILTVVLFGAAFSLYLRLRNKGIWRWNQRIVTHFDYWNIEKQKAAMAEFEKR